MAGERYNVLVMMLDDVNFGAWASMRRLATRVIPDGGSGQWVHFDRMYVQYALCGPSRYTFLTGRYGRHLGVFGHYNAQGTLLDTADTPASGPLPDSVTACDRDHGIHTLPVWLKEAGYNTAAFGKWCNEYPFHHPEGDFYNPPGLDHVDLCLDDHSLKSIGGGATYPGHTYHTGPDYGGSTAPGFVRNRGDGTTTTNRTPPSAPGQPWTGGTDGWFDAASVGTSQGKRVLSPKTQTDYYTDLFSWQSRDWIANEAVEPWFCYIAHRAAHNVIVPPFRHNSATFAAFDGTYRIASPSPADAFDPPGFNEANIDDKPTWFKATYPNVIPASGGSGDTVASLRAEQVAAWRALQSVDEAIYDVVQQLSAATSPNPTTGVSEPTIDHTVIMITNDNGYTRGTNRATGKMTPYEPSIRSRLVVYHPDIRQVADALDPGPGQHTDHALVSMVDLAPTICAIAGVRPTRAFDGMDLTPRILDNTFGWRREIRGEFNANPGVANAAPHHSWIVAMEPYDDTPNASFSQLYKYVLIPPKTAAYTGAGNWTVAEDELYDLTGDPGETTNLNNSAEHAELLADLAKRRSRLHSV